MNIAELGEGFVFSVKDCVAYNANNNYQPMCQLKEGSIVQIRAVVPERNMVLITPEPMPLLVDFDSLKGIPITAQLLVRIGFVFNPLFTLGDYPIPMDAYVKNVEGQDIVVVEQADEFCLAFSGAQLAVTKYVHRLQGEIRTRFGLDITFDGIERFLGE